MRLLVVEDADKLAQVLKRGLEKEGYAVDTLGDGLRARRLACAAATTSTTWSCSTSCCRGSTASASAATCVSAA